MHRHHVDNSNEFEYAGHPNTPICKAAIAITKDATGNAKSDTGDYEGTSIIRYVKNGQHLPTNLNPLSLHKPDRLIGSLQLPKDELTLLEQAEIPNFCEDEKLPVNHFPVTENLLPCSSIVTSRFCSSASSSTKVKVNHHKFNVISQFWEAGEDNEKASKIYGLSELPGVVRSIGSEKQVQSLGNMQRESDPRSDLLREGFTRESSSTGANRATGRENVMKPDHKKNADGFRSAGSERREWSFQAKAATFVQIQASHLLKTTIMLMLVIFVSSMVFYARIQALEEDKKAMLGEIGNLKLHMQLLVTKLDDIRLAIPKRSERNSFASFEPTQESFDEGTDMNAGNNSGKQHIIAKRAANRGTKELLYPPPSMGVNGLNNGTSTPYEVNDWTLPASGNQKSSKGEARAVYLQIDGSSVNIKKQRQLIGPWYLPTTGNEIEFNDRWYNGFALDSNGTSVIFKESGLYMISAQVFYQLQHLHNAKPIPMGYRMHLRKNQRNGQPFRRPLTIAECVPSFPTTIYQTCFTQVVWYIEAQDQVYLEHFTEALPVIEALRNGQTFLGIVRL